MREAVEAIWRDDSAPADHPTLAAHRALVQGRSLGAPRWLKTQDDILLAKAHGMAALGRLDIHRLQRVLAPIEGLPCDDAHAVEREVLAAWHQVLSKGTHDDLDELGARAARSGLGLARIETTALQAFVRGEQGDVDDALQLARRCARMASTEAMPLSKAIAGWSLARARRRVGDSYLTVKIAVTAEALGGAHFAPILSWESALAGARASGFPGESVGKLVDRPEDVAALSALEVLCRQAKPYADELSSLRHGRGVDCPAPENMSRWCAWDDVPCPPGFRGIFGGKPERPFGWIHVTPSRRRRQLALRQATTMAPRLRAAFAVLALAEGNRLDSRDLFRAVYGFAYDAGVHSSLYRKLLSRMRQALTGEPASLLKSGERISLEVRGDLWFPDPACEPKVEERVCWVFSESPKSSLREVAESCGLPVRTVQRVAQEMVEAGVLSSTRVHRHVRYRVEDSVWTHATDLLASRGAS